MTDRHECIRPPPTEPFRDLVDDHVPFRLTRVIRRNWWRLALFCLLFDVAAFCAVEAMR